MIAQKSTTEIAIARTRDRIMRLDGPDRDFEEQILQKLLAL